jgi:DNA-directed RNA polymerase subunit RPC12/RpoP
MKYIAVYKCLMCNTILHYGEPHEATQEDLEVTCGQVIHNQLFAGNPYLHKVQIQIPHKCKNGDCGIAYFSGFTQSK